MVPRDNDNPAVIALHASVVSFDVTKDQSRESEIESEALNYKKVQVK